MADNLWYLNTVFYEVHTRAYYDFNGDGMGDLKGLTQKLDYIKNLGIDCIWLLPIYPSPLKDDGYDIADFYGIHPDLGTIDDFKELVAETHQKNMFIITDLVLNHTSDQCEWFIRAEEDENSPYHDYYVWSKTDDKYPKARIIFTDTENSNWAWSNKAQKYYWHRFFSSQPDLNYDNPAVREEIKNVMRFWLDLGVDGFRADAVPYLFEREGTNCENLPETHAYLKELRAFMDEEYPGRILLAEANQWPKDLKPYFSNGDEFHMAFHFPIMPRIFKALAIGDNQPIVQIMNETPTIPETCQWCTFLRNHDELTLEMVTEQDRQFLWDFYAPDDRMRLNLGIRRRLAPLLDGDQQKIELLYAILFSLTGTPIIYYGDEIGMGDCIDLNDRDGVRTPMQWNAGAYAGFTSGHPKKLYQPLIDSGKYHYAKVNAESAIKDADSLFNRLKNLISIRKQHPTFCSQNLSFTHPENTGVLSVIRSDERETFHCIHNLTAHVQTIDLRDKTYVFLPTPIEVRGKKNTVRDRITLAPYDYRWLQQIKKVN